PGPGPLRERLVAGGAEVRTLPLAVLRRRLMRPTGVARLGWDLARSLPPLVALGHAVEADLVHSSSSAVVSGAVAARLLRRPHVVTVREDLGLPGGAVPALLLQLGTRRVVAVSRSVEDGLLRRRPRLAGRVRVVADGVD